MPVPLQSFLLWGQVGRLGCRCSAVVVCLCGVESLCLWGLESVAVIVVVHVLGGTCALVGCFFIGPRLGRFGTSSQDHMPGHSVPLAGLGGFILLFGFLAFNGGSQVIFTLS